MFRPKVCSVLICVALGLLTRHGFADDSQELLTTDDTIQNGTQSNEVDAIQDEDHDAEAVEGHNATDSAEEYREAVERFKENPTAAYWKNLSAKATDVLTSIWRNQTTYLNGIGEERGVVFQTYKVELKKITYLVEKTNELVKKQCNAIPKINWTETDEKVAQPYHDDVIGQLAKNWDEMERYFNANKLRGVDYSVKRVNRLIQTVKEELSNHWPQLKKLRLEMKYYMRFCKENSVPF